MEPTTSDDRIARRERIVRREGDVRRRTVRDAFRAYEVGDRALMERLLADDMVFHSPADTEVEVYFGWELPRAA